MNGEFTWWWWLVAGAVAVLAIVVLWLWRKGRPVAPGDVFRASRLSRGNRLLPSQVIITPTSVVHYKPQWVGKMEKTIHMAHVSSVNIDTGLFLSDILIETTGGHHPIGCHGHHKSDAVAMKALIERYQTDYYKSAPPSSSVPPSNTPNVSGR